MLETFTLAPVSPSIVSPECPCNLEALCWSEKAVVVPCRPAWCPPASPIHCRAVPGGCLCVECSTPWSLEPDGVWERSLGFLSLRSAVQTCCHIAAPALSFSACSTIPPNLLSVCFIHNLSLHRAILTYSRSFSLLSFSFTYLCRLMENKVKPKKRGFLFSFHANSQVSNCLLNWRGGKVVCLKGHVVRFHSRVTDMKNRKHLIIINLL